MAPIFQVTKLDISQLDSAPYLFLDWHYDHTGAPMIFRADDLSLVYADQWYPHVKNTRVQELGGERFLTFWEGADFWGYGRGGCLFFDEGYNLRYNITPIGDQFELLTDLHECQVTEEGTVLIAIYDPIPFDLSPIGGPVDGTLLDGVFQEIDPKTNSLVFEWRASDHYSITDSPETVEDNMREHGFDFYHMNSVAKYGKNYLVSSASFNHAILINGTDGSTIWTLGGEDNDFQFLHGDPGFAMPHQPRLLKSEDNSNHVTLFDNQVERVNAVGCTANCSRGIHVKLDHEKKTAEVVREFFHPMSLKSLAQGGFTSLKGGNVLVAWGTQPGVTEHKANGEVVMDIQFGRIGNEYHPEWNAAYRVFKGHWKGQPAWDPSIAVEDGTVYVSWNGATEVAGWIVFGSDHADKIHGSTTILAKSPRRGFETVIPLSHVPRYLRAAATDSKGRVLGYTAAWDCTTGAVVG